MPSVPPKMSPGAQNIKTGPDSLDTVENDSAQNMKTGADALDTCATLFCALYAAAGGRWVAEEGHGDPSRACICLVSVEFTV
jgi:hypothetical protein